MENTVIQHTFPKFDRSRKTLEPQITHKYPRSNEKKQQWQQVLPLCYEEKPQNLPWKILQKIIKKPRHTKC